MAKYFFNFDEQMRNLSSSLSEYTPENENLWANILEHPEHPLYEIIRASEDQPEECKMFERIREALITEITQDWVQRLKNGNETKFFILKVYKKLSEILKLAINVYDEEDGVKLGGYSFDSLNVMTKPYFVYLRRVKLAMVEQQSFSTQDDGALYTPHYSPVSPSTSVVNQTVELVESNHATASNQMLSVACTEIPTADFDILSRKQQSFIPSTCINMEAVNLSSSSVTEQYGIQVVSGSAQSMQGSVSTTVVNSSSLTPTNFSSFQSKLQELSQEMQNKKSPLSADETQLSHSNHSSINTSTKVQNTQKEEDSSYRLEGDSNASGSNFSSATDRLLSHLTNEQLQNLVNCSRPLTREQLHTMSAEDEHHIRQSYSQMSFIMFDWLSRIYVNAGFHKNVFVKRNNQIMTCKCCPLHCIVAVSKTAKKPAGRKPKSCSE